MAVVGIIANPASGKDIRRLVAHATVFDNIEKVNLVRRILLGLQAAGVEKTIIMPDYYGIGYKALNGLNKNQLTMPVEILAMDITGTQEDSFKAAQILKEQVDCIITLGGDGTNRIVAKGCGDTPMVPVSTGTNNVFPIMLEGTVAGLAAGFIATGGLGPDVGLTRQKRIDVYLDGKYADIALVDAVVLKDQFIGSRAIWNADNIQEIFATRGSLQNIGIVSIVAALEPIATSDQHGMHVEIGQGGSIIKAALGPGLMVHVPIKAYNKFYPEQRVVAGSAPFIVALDGEREIEVKKGTIVEMVLNPNGPRVVDVETTLNLAAQRGLMQH